MCPLENLQPVNSCYTVTVFPYTFLLDSGGSYTPALSEKRNSFLRLLKKKGCKEERMTKVGLYAIGSSTTLESNKSPAENQNRRFLFKGCSVYKPNTPDL